MAELSSGLEQQIAQIEQDLAAKREALRQQQESGSISIMPQEKETLHEVVGDTFQLGSNPTPVTPPTPATDSTAATPPPPTATTPIHLSPEMKVKIQELVNIAFTKSLEEAVSLAKATNNAAFIDAFHDLLVDELYAHLVERGKLTKF